jgi:hypothetical protein
MQPDRPDCAARIEDLGPGDFVRAECVACGHDELIPASALLQAAGDHTRARFAAPVPVPGMRYAREGGGVDLDGASRQTDFGTCQEA